MPRPLPTSAALALAGALLLTACGGAATAPSSPDNEETSRAAAGSAPAASAATAPAAKRPSIALPPTFQLTFADWTSSDTVKQAVLDDAKDEVRAGYAAIIANDPDSEAVAFYDSERVVKQTREWIESYTDKDVTVIGKLPVFDPDLTIGANRASASLSYCTDEGKAYTKNRGTGEVLGNPTGTDPEVFYVTSLARNAQGVWQTVSVHSERGGCS